jgi:hypothetical protein
MSCTNMRRNDAIAQEGLEVLPQDSADPLRERIHVVS